MTNEEISDALVNAAHLDVGSLDETTWRVVIWRRVAQFEAHLRTLEERFAVLGGRLTTLERFSWAIGGGLAVCTVIVAPLLIRAILAAS